MKVQQRLWTVEKILALKSEIDLNPAWQRGPAWPPARRVLLIDSILRGMDVPKIYLRKCQSGGLYKYEAVDGQQRLRAIFDFYDKQSQLEPLKGFELKSTESLPPIEGNQILGKRYGGLAKPLKDKFLKFKLGIGEITESTNDEITVLFARLQMGMPLNPAELRNADLGPMRNLIKLMATSHEFFEATNIRDVRTKHFDFASYAFAITASLGRQDMKAPDLRALQQDYNSRPLEELTELSARVGNALNVLAEVDLAAVYRIDRKWLFVDLLLLVLQRLAAGKAIDVIKFTAAYDRFEARRREYTSSPEDLLRRRRRDAQPNDVALYEYIYAFRTEGAKSANILKRNKAISKFFTRVEPR
jgi:Protein of unknown function DUF262